MPSTTDSAATGLDHVVLAGGTPSEWLLMSSSEWETRLANLAHGAAVENAHWVTLLPHHGNELTVSEYKKFAELMKSISGVTEVGSSEGGRFVWKSPTGCHVIIDVCPDGHIRFARTVEGLRQQGVDANTLSEGMLSIAILSPAENEADLVLILGSPDRIPDSMVWELAYSELVFIDIAWSDLNSSHLELAIDDFNRRHRRFGGLDS